MKREDVEAAEKQLSGKLGQVIGVTKEFIIDQRLNDVFGALTGNPDPMHNDPEWAETSPLGGTVIYGFLQSSLITGFWKELGMPLVTSDESYTFNYGLDRLRFPSSLDVGAPAQATLRILDIDRKSADKIIWRYEVTLRQRGRDKPTMIAEVLFCTVFYRSNADSGSTAKASENEYLLGA